MHILLVEDEVRLARVIVSVLIKAGHDPVVTHDGELALQKAASESFDLIVLGIGLPRMNGFEVLRRLRSRHVTSRVLDPDRLRRGQRSHSALSQTQSATQSTTQSFAAAHMML